jgi:putative ABC transport system permease protein
MFRSALAAALRHLYRGKLHAAIAVLGLAVGLCGALLAGLYIRSQYSFEHFVPGYQDVYLTTLAINVSDRTVFSIPETPAQVAGLMRQQYPQIASITRVAWQKATLRVDDIEQPGEISSVDPDFFETVPLPAVAGNPAAALAQPDTVVMTRDYARTFFGDEPPLGRTLELHLQDGSRQVVTIGALIGEIPRHRSQLQWQMFISGRTAWTRLASLDRRSGQIRGVSSEVRTLVRLRPGASPDPMRQTLAPMLLQFMRKSAAPEEDVRDGPQLRLLRIDRVHTDPEMNPGFATRILMAVVLGCVILAIACVNFVNLLTARSATRAVEVGMRKLAGAGRGTLALQFLGEALALVAIAVLLGMAMTELLLPRVNAFLDADASFDYWREPVVLGWMLLAAVLLGLLAGGWPALVLSSLRPIGAMHGTRLTPRSGGSLRQVLVTLQFALLIGLIVAAGVVYLQRHFAMQAALRFATDQMLIADMDCTPARLTELRALAGVRAAACSDVSLNGDGQGAASGKTRDGQPITLNMSWIDDQVLQLYGIQPLAGRLLQPSDFDLATGRSSINYLINEAAMRRLGFESPAAALGPYPLMNDLQHIVGVLPDFSMGNVSQAIEPTLFHADVGNLSRMNIKLKGQDIPATLAGIDRIWNATGGTGRLERFFYEERVEQRYRAMLREAQAFGIIALVAVLLACLGLFGLAAAVAEQRTKEIGIRKALGANTRDVLRLLLWQFSKPVMWANLIAWPVAGWAMQRWLAGFAYHIDLPLWLFPLAGLLALGIALATVSAHSLRVAGTKPVTALRHE